MSEAKGSGVPVGEAVVVKVRNLVREKDRQTRIVSHQRVAKGSLLFLGHLQAYAVSGGTAAYQASRSM